MTLYKAATHLFFFLFSFVFFSVCHLKKKKSSHGIFKVPVEESQRSRNCFFTQGGLEREKKKKIGITLAAQIPVGLPSKMSSLTSDSKQSPELSFLCRFLPSSLFPPRRFFIANIFFSFFPNSSAAINSLTSWSYKTLRSSVTHGNAHLETESGSALVLQQGLTSVCGGGGVKRQEKKHFPWLTDQCSSGCRTVHQGRCSTGNFQGDVIDDLFKVTG